MNNHVVDCDRPRTRPRAGDVAGAAYYVRAAHVNDPTTTNETIAHAKPTTYLLTLESTPKANDPGSVRGLRMALKGMLRRHGLRCTDAREVT